MELKRTEVGNQATEQGAYEGGADAWAIDHGTIVAERDALEVDAEVVGNDLQLVPRSSSFHSGLGELQEGPLDILSAKLLEEPDETGLSISVVNGITVEANDGRLAEISHRTARESLVWYGYSSDGLSAVLGDRVDVLKDVLESAYSCKACHGKGHTETVCKLCMGTHYEVTDESGHAERVPCRGCKVLGFGMDQIHSSGFQKCEKCSGSGWKNGIVIPEQSQQEAITGIVVSLGPDCKIVKLGDRVVHSKFAGHTLKMSESNQIVTMRESEILKILRQR